MDLKDLDIYFNYHTHTNRNGHGSTAPDEDYVKRAIKAGISILGFSEHCPYKEKLNSDQTLVRMRYDQLDEYFASIDALNEKYKGQCEILKAFECEYYPNHLDTIRELREVADYLILGQHFNTIDEPDYHPYSFFCSEEEARVYADRICKGLATGLYDYLAHPDYFYGGTADISDVFIECSHRICKACEETDTPMEVNFNGNAKYDQGTAYLRKNHYHYPNRVFWQIASGYKIRCIVGFDAHKPELFDQKEDLIKDFSPVVDGLGLNFITEAPFRRKDRKENG